MRLMSSSTVFQLVVRSAVSAVARDCPVVLSAGTMAAGTSDFLQITKIIHRRIVTDVHPLGPHEHTMLHHRRLAPVPRAVDAAIVLAHGLVKMDAHPGTRAVGDVLDVSDVLDHSPPGVIASHAAPLPDLNPPVVDVLSEGGNLGFLAARGVGIEPTKLLSLLPGKHGIGLLGVFFLGHDILVNARGVGVVWPGARWSGVQDLGGLGLAEVQKNEGGSDKRSNKGEHSTTTMQKKWEIPQVKALGTYVQLGISHEGEGSKIGCVLVAGCDGYRLRRCLQ